MRKICVVCGYATENNIRECPNCGSYDLKTVGDRVSPIERFRRRGRHG